MKGVGYRVSVWKAPVGWWADFGVISGIPGKYGPDVWRPTKRWARRVVMRRVERKQRAEARLDAASTEIFDG